MTHSPAAMIDGLSRLDAALGQIMGQAVHNDLPRTMTDAQIIALARLAESLGRRADVLRVCAAGELDDRSRSERGEARLSMQHGCADATGLLTRLTQVSLGTAKDRVRTARSVATTTSLTGETLPARFPTLRDAFWRGAIGIDTVSAIVRTFTPIVGRADPSQQRVAERELVAAAEGTTDNPPLAADETQLQAKVWALVLDPDGALPAYERAVRRRGLTLGRESEGLVPIRGTLLPDVAEQFRRLIDAHLSPRVADQTRITGPTFVDGDAADNPVVPHDPRSRTQKQHDVFASILGVSARAAETPMLGGAAPTLLVTIAASELHSRDGVGFVDGTDTTVPAFVARQIACCGGIQRSIFDDDGRIIQLGSPQRVFTPQQRRAITARDGGCVIPGCHVRATWCEIHHAVEHSKGGPTHTDNGVMLCWWHHRTLETSGWHVRLTNGVPEVLAPYSMDPQLLWRPVSGSPHRERQRLRRRLSTA